MTAFLILVSIIIATIIFFVGFTVGGMHQLTIQIKESRKRLQELEDKLHELETKCNP